MKIGIIDADLIGRKKHRFPNLACMKISGYYKSNGNEVHLLLDYNKICEYDKVFISKVFTDTFIDSHILELENVEYGGTGFFYDKAPALPDYIEHHMPDYSLYDDFINYEVSRGISIKEFNYYKNYSIGFTTRGCFRKCPFCVNKNANKVIKHSPIEEFLDKDRKYICLLDDNILGYSDCEGVFNELKKTGKRFEYKQGMDERLLTHKKCEMIANAPLNNEIYFAFDNVEDAEIIENKLQLMRNYTHKRFSFYVLCAFDRDNKYDEEFWKNDIINVFKRLNILNRYDCKPYIMRYEMYNSSPIRGFYIALASWANQPAMYKSFKFREYCIKKGINAKVYSEYNVSMDAHRSMARIFTDFCDLGAGAWAPATC